MNISRETLVVIVRILWMLAKYLVDLAEIEIQEEAIETGTSQEVFFLRTK